MLGEDKVSGQAKLFTDPQGQAPAPPTAPGLAQAAAHPQLAWLCTGTRDGGSTPCRPPALPRSRPTPPPAFCPCPLTPAPPRHTAGVAQPPSGVKVGKAGPRCGPGAEGRGLRKGGGWHLAVAFWKNGCG